MRLHYLLIVLFLFPFFESYSQKYTNETIAEFMNGSSLKVVSIKKDTTRELAHSLENIPYPMAWLPGKDLKVTSSSLFEISHPYILTYDDKHTYMVLAVPRGAENVMNIKIQQVTKDIIEGELLIPEYMFYDPQNPPVLPPPTYIQITRDKSQLKNLFSPSNTLGRWEIKKVNGCDFPMPFEFTLKTEGQVEAKAKGEEMYMTWRSSPAGGYIYLEPADFSERIIGIRTDENTIDAYSDVTKCRFLIQKK